MDNQPQSKIWVWTWTDGWGGAWYYSGANPDFPTLYYVTIDITAKAGKWYVAVVDGDKSKNRISDIVTYTTDNNSDTGACNDQVVDFKANW